MQSSLVAGPVQLRGQIPCIDLAPICWHGPWHGQLGELSSWIRHSKVCVLLGDYGFMFSC